MAERRRQIHDRTARAIETLDLRQLEDQYSVLARHFLLGNDAGSAIRYARLAAEQATNLAAYSEATNVLEAALKLLDRLPIALSGCALK